MMMEQIQRAWVMVVHIYSDSNECNTAISPARKKLHILWKHILYNLLLFNGGRILLLLVRVAGVIAFLYNLLLFNGG